MFGDPELNRLEGLATTNNQQLAAAYANFQQARALVSVARADFFPQISANPSYTRQRISANQSAGAGSSSQRLHLQHLQRPARCQLGARPLGPRAPRGRRRPRQPDRLRR